MRFECLGIGVMAFAVAALAGALAMSLIHGLFVTIWLSKVRRQHRRKVRREKENKAIDSLWNYLQGESKTERWFRNEMAGRR